MLVVVGLFGAVAATVVACLANRFPAYSAALEAGAGVMLIAGLALAGQALPIML